MKMTNSNYNGANNLQKAFKNFEFESVVES